MYLVTEERPKADPGLEERELPFSPFHTDPRKINWRRRTLAALRKGHGR